MYARGLAYVWEPMGTLHSVMLKGGVCVGGAGCRSEWEEECMGGTSH